MDFHEKIVAVLKANIGDFVEVTGHKRSGFGILKEVVTEGEIHFVTVDIGSREEVITIDEIIMVKTAERSYCKEDF